MENELDKLRALAESFRFWQHDLTNRSFRVVLGKLSEAESSRALSRNDALLVEQLLSQRALEAAQNFHPDLYDDFGDDFGEFLIPLLTSCSNGVCE